jgi:type VI protein secretion system component VasK
MEALIEKMRLLAKAEVILVRLHLRRAVRQVSFVLVAALFGLMALAMLNVAFYLFLAPRIDPALAALAVAGLDTLLAVVAVVAASRLELGPEAEDAASIRDVASRELAADAERVRAQLDDLVQDIKRIRSAVTGITQPGGISLPVIFQWIMMFVTHLLRKRG